MIKKVAKKKATKKTEQPSIQQIWEDLGARTIWFTTPSFTQQEAADIAGISYGQLRQWNSREQMPFINLMERGRPGARRLYTAEDILVIRAVTTLKSIGMPISTPTIGWIVQRIKTRAVQLLHRAIDKEGMKMLIALNPEGDYTQAEIYEYEELEELFSKYEPIIFSIFSVDDLIMEVIETTLKLIQGEEGETH